MTNPNMDVSTQTVCWFCWETLCNTVRQRLTLSLSTSVKRTADMPHTSCIILFWRLCSLSPYTHTSANMKKRSRTHKCKGWGMNTEVSHTKRIKNTELNRHLKHTSWTHTHTNASLQMYSLLYFCPLVNKPHLLSTDYHWFQQPGQTNCLASWAALSPANWLVLYACVAWVDSMERLWGHSDARTAQQGLLKTWGVSPCQATRKAD